MIKKQINITINKFIIFHKFLKKKMNCLNKLMNTNKIYLKEVIYCIMYMNNAKLNSLSSRHCVY